MHLLRQVVVVLGQVGEKLLDDVEAMTIVLLLGNDERLEVARVVAHEEGFAWVVMGQVLGGEDE